MYRDVGWSESGINGGIHDTVKLYALTTHSLRSVFPSESINRTSVMIGASFASSSSNLLILVGKSQAPPPAAQLAPHPPIPLPAQTSAPRLFVFPSKKTSHNPGRWRPASRALRRRMISRARKVVMMRRRAPATNPPPIPAMLEEAFTPPWLELEVLVGEAVEVVDTAPFHCL
jgi:hypothetical protein